MTVSRSKKMYRRHMYQPDAPETPWWWQAGELALQLACVAAIGMAIWAVFK